MILIFYIIAKIINFFDERFIAWVILNTLIFYGPIEKKCPYFLFKSRMFIMQLIDGTYGLLCSFNPYYQPKMISE